MSSWRHNLAKMPPCSSHWWLDWRTQLLQEVKFSAEPTTNASRLRSAALRTRASIHGLVCTAQRLSWTFATSTSSACRVAASRECAATFSSATPSVKRIRTAWERRFRGHAWTSLLLVWRARQAHPGAAARTCALRRSYARATSYWAIFATQTASV